MLGVGIPRVTAAPVTVTPHVMATVAIASTAGLVYTEDKDGTIAWRQIQTEVNAAVFGADVEPGAYFVLASVPTGEGIYGGQGVGERDVKFDIVSFEKIDTSATALATQADASMTYVLGTLSGDAGSIAMSGLIAYVKNSDGAMAPFLFPTDTSLAVAAIAQNKAARAPSWHNSTPESIVNGRPDGARNPNEDINCNQGSTPLANCICFAQQSWDLCMISATVAMELAMAALVAALAFRLLLCAPAAVVPVLGWMVAGGCVYVNAAATLLLIAGVWVAFQAAVNACDRNLRHALRRCGVQIPEI